MKRKKQLQDNPVEEPKSSNFETAIIFVVLILFILSSVEVDYTLNYPEYFTYRLSFFLIFIITFIVVLIKRNDYKKSKDNIDKLIFVIGHIIFIAATSFAFARILLYPFDIYNSNYSKKNEVKTIKCEITYLYYSNVNATQRKFSFEFNDEIKTISSDEDIVRKIYFNNNDYKDYIFVAKIRKGLFDSYCIESWDLVHK